MFMVRLDLYAKHGEVVRSAQRAVSVCHPLACLLFIFILLYFYLTLNPQLLLVHYLYVAVCNLASLFIGISLLK